MRKSANENTNIIETTIWNQELSEGASIEGVYKFNAPVKTKFGESIKYVVIDPSGKAWAIFGSASLNRQFAKIPEGSYVWITYDGTETTKNGRTVKIFNVDYDDEYNK